MPYTYQRQDIPIQAGTYIFLAIKYLSESLSKHLEWERQVSHKSSSTYPAISDIFSSRKTYSLIVVLDFLQSDMFSSVPRLPQSSWCSHMHVSSTKYPTVPEAQYSLSSDHTVSDALKYYAQWGVSNLVFVQPSIYGTDNSCLLDGLRQATPDHGRGVVTIDPENTSQAMLREWHGMGVRGVRLNLVSAKKQGFDQDRLAEILEAYAKIMRPLKTWVLEIYIEMAMLDALVKIVPRLGVKFAIAHCGNPKLPTHPASVADPSSIPGFRSLTTLLDQGSTWVKISGAYRLTEDAEMKDLEPLLKETLSRAPTRVCWAGDWPHTRFEGVDINPFIHKCIGMTAGALRGKTEDDRRTMLFRDNTKELFDAA